MKTLIITVQILIYIQCYEYRHNVHYSMPQEIDENFQIYKRLERVCLAGRITNKQASLSLYILDRC